MILLRSGLGVGRLGLLVLATLALMAASAPTRPNLMPVMPGFTEQAPAPAPPPPATGAMPPLITAAPMPDLDVDAPQKAEADGPELSPSFINPKKQFMGDGYAAGSTLQDQQTGRRPMSPGLELRMPLQ